MAQCAHSGMELIDGRYVRSSRQAERVKAMIRKEELLTVQEHFDITGRGLVLLPDFEVPEGWKNRSEAVLVVTPDGMEHECAARFELIHFNIRDPSVGANRRWRVSVSLPAATKAAVPIGSKLLCGSELKTALVGGRNA
jgi:hypothetical protein